MPTGRPGSESSHALAERTTAAPRAANPPRVGRRSHRDLETLVHAGRLRGYEMTLTGPERGPWTRDQVVLGRGAVRVGAEGGANVGHGRVPDFMVAFHLALSGPPPICGGTRPGWARIGVFGPGADQIEAVRGPSRWATFSAAPDVIDGARARLGIAAPVFEPGRAHVLRVSRETVLTLRAVVARIETRIVETPADFEDADLRSRLLDELAMKFTAGVAAGTPVRPVAGDAAPEHERILLACMRHLGASQDHVVTIEELRGAVACSERTLTRVFAESFDISPARYLRLRRLNQARAWLRRGDPARASVTAAATRFGFFELGRFAGNYRRLFGELPSETLGRRDRN